MLVIVLAAPGGAASSGRAVVADAVPDYATSARDVGAAKGPIRVAVALGWRHADRLDRLIEAVSNPESPRYARYLSPAEFRARFSPTERQVRAVRGWLTSRGLEVTGVSASRMLVEAEGGAAAAERAFGTTLRRYRADGRTLRAPSNPVTVPGRLGGTVLGVLGLAETPYSPNTDSIAPPSPASRNAGPCSQYWSEHIAHHQPAAYGSKRPWQICGYRPRQIQSVYGVRHAINEGRDGSGQKVGIIDAFESPTLREDLDTYSRRHGLPRARLSTKRFFGCQVQCGDTNQQGWYTEQSLDVEAVHTMAPGAHIKFVGGYDADNGIFKALTWAVDHRIARIISNSYGGPDASNTQAEIASTEQVAKQAIAQGIGLYFSTGDFGDDKAEFGYVTTQYPASSPHVTGMGANMLGIGPERNFRFETAWGLHLAKLSGGQWMDPPGPFENGGGGGTTRLFAEPGYQRGVVPGRLAKRWGGRGRVLPDISMVGDPSTGFLIGQTQTFPDGSERYNQFSVGGTSVASPMFAGYMALADEAAGFHHGFVNPALYRLYGRKPLRDVKSVRTNIAQVLNQFKNGLNADDGVETFLRTGNMDSSLKATKGFDNATGLGSPRGRKLLRALKHR